MWLFLALVGVPILEIALFIEVGGAIGLWPTLAIVIGTALAGTLLLRAQGREAMTRLQRSLAEGGDPGDPIAHGAMILVAGVLLLTPGFFTDGLGFALLLPPVRAALIRRGAAAMAAGVRSGRVTIVTAGGASGPRGPGRGHADGDVIEGEWTPADAETQKPDADTDADTARDDDRPSRPGTSGWTRP